MGFVGRPLRREAPLWGVARRAVASIFLAKMCRLRLDWHLNAGEERHIRRDPLIKSAGRVPTQAERYRTAHGLVLPRAAQSPTKATASTDHQSPSARTWAKERVGVALQMPTASSPRCVLARCLHALTGSYAMRYPTIGARVLSLWVTRESSGSKILAHLTT